MKWETREIEVPVERIVTKEVERIVEVPCVETRVEYVDRVVERDLVVREGRECFDGGITEREFVDLWNRMLTIDRHGLRDCYLTGDRFIEIIELACRGRRGGFVASGPTDTIVIREEDRFRNRPVEYIEPEILVGRPEVIRAGSPMRPV